MIRLLTGRRVAVTGHHPSVMTARLLCSHSLRGLTFGAAEVMRRFSSSVPPFAEESVRTPAVFGTPSAAAPSSPARTRTTTLDTRGLTVAQQIDGILTLIHAPHRRYESAVYWCNALIDAEVERWRHEQQQLQRNLPPNRSRHGGSGGGGTGGLEAGHLRSVVAALSRAHRMADVWRVMEKWYAASAMTTAGGGGAAAGLPAPDVNAFNDVMAGTLRPPPAGGSEEAAGLTSTTTAAAAAAAASSFDASGDPIEHVLNWYEVMRTRGVRPTIDTLNIVLEAYLRRERALSVAPVKAGGYDPHAPFVPHRLNSRSDEEEDGGGGSSHSGGGGSGGVGVGITPETQAAIARLLQEMSSPAPITPAVTPPQPSSTLPSPVASSAVAAATLLSGSPQSERSTIRPNVATYDLLIALYGCVGGAGGNALVYGAVNRRKPDLDSVQRIWNELISPESGIARPATRTVYLVLQAYCRGDWYDGMTSVLQYLSDHRLPLTPATLQIVVRMYARQREVSLLHMMLDHLSAHVQQYRRRHSSAGGPAAADTTVIDSAATTTAAATAGKAPPFPLAITGDDTTDPADGGGKRGEAGIRRESRDDWILSAASTALFDWIFIGLTEAKRYPPPASASSSSSDNTTATTAVTAATASAAKTPEHKTSKPSTPTHTTPAASKPASSTTAAAAAATAAVSPAVVLAFWRRMKDEFHLRPTLHTYNTVLNLMAASGDLESLESIAAEMRADRIQPTAYTYAALIRGYGSRQRYTEIERLIAEWRTPSASQQTDGWLSRQRSDANAALYSVLIRVYADRCLRLSRASSTPPPPARTGPNHTAAAATAVTALTKQKKRAVDALCEVWEEMCAAPASLMRAPRVPTVLAFLRGLSAAHEWRRLWPYYRALTSNDTTFVAPPTTTATTTAAAGGGRVVRRRPDFTPITPTSAVVRAVLEPITRASTIRPVIRAAATEFLQSSHWSFVGPPRELRADQRARFEGLLQRLYDDTNPS